MSKSSSSKSQGAALSEILRLSSEADRAYEEARAIALELGVPWVDIHGYKPPRERKSVTAKLFGSIYDELVIRLKVLLFEVLYIVALALANGLWIWFLIAYVVPWVLGY